MILAGVRLAHPLMNAAGTCKSLEDVERFARSAVSAVVVGSVTCEPREGNPGDVYWAGGGYSLNALGLPNRGLDYYVHHVPQMVELAHAAGKPLVASLAGFTVDDYAELASAFTGADLLELNLACPNVWSDGQQKRIACFDLDQTERVCRAVHTALADAGEQGGRRPAFGVKISPFSDPQSLTSLAKRLTLLSTELDTLRFVVAVNTFPNGYEIGAGGRKVVTVGLAGVSGAALKPIGMGQVRQLREMLPAGIDVVGVGGVMQGRDLEDYLSVGAAAVQAATVYWNAGENPRVFGEILAGFVNDMGPSTAETVEAS